MPRVPIVVVHGWPNLELIAVYASGAVVGPFEYGVAPPVLLPSVKELRAPSSRTTGGV